MDTLNTQRAGFKKLDINNLPLLEKASNWLEWEDITAHIAPPIKGYTHTHLHSLESNEQRDLFIAWVKEEVPEEVHTDEIESFLILEGSCVCNIIKKDGAHIVRRLGAGEFISIKPGEIHDIKISSFDPVKAILQRAKVGKAE